MRDTVIVLTEENVIIAGGKEGRTPKLEKVEKIELTGLGNPMEQYREALTSWMKSGHPEKVKLVLPPTSSTVRVSQLPYATGRQLSRMAANVVAENAGDGVADYSVAAADKTQGTTICLGSAESDYLEKLTGMCAELGISLKGITVPMEGYLKIINRVKSCQGKTAVYLFFEDNYLTSLLYKNGIYMYSARNRIFSEKGTLDFGTEIVRNISGLVQFYTTRKESAVLTDVYYAGCSDDDFGVSVEGIRAMNLQVQRLPLKHSGGKKSPEDVFLCLGALYKGKGKKINLYRAFHKIKAKEAKQKGFRFKDVLLPVITLLCCLLAFCGVCIWNLHTTSEIRVLDNWINDSFVQQQYQEANSRKTVSSQLANAIRQVKQMKANLDTYPDITEKMVNELVDVSGRDIEVKIQSASMETGVLAFNAVSREVIDIPSYVQRLEKTGLFETVNYTGYSYDNEQYTLMLSCVLKAEEAGGDAQ